MSDQTSLQDFFAAWTIDNADGRAAKIASAIGDNFRYVDPRTPEPITSVDAMSAYLADFINNCPPGAKVEVADPVDTHPGHARATIRFIMGPDMQMTGQYFADLDAAGKLTRLIGFVGKGAE